MNNFNEWYEKNYHELSGSGIWLRGGEVNTIDPSLFDKSSCRILITRLSTWKDTADSFTHKLLYRIASEVNGMFPDLAYLPPLRDSEIFTEHNVPWLLGSSSKRPACDFDLIAISLSIVQELINIPIMLRKSEIPAGKKERMENPSIPLIILGGASAPFTSALMSEDPLVDAVFVGENASDIKKIFSICNDLKKINLAKAEILKRLEESIPGFFQPDKPSITKKHASELSSELLLGSAPVLYSEEQLGAASLQISDGCPCFCSFCAESWNRKPYREFSSETLKSAALSMKAKMGLDSVELYSFNFNMHSEFYTILRDMCSIFSSVGLKSQRFDYIASNPEILQYLHAAGKSSITCGLEGISSRLRNYLHKSIDEKSLRFSLNALFRAPLRELKIFLIATGLENESDFEELRSLLSFISESMHSAGRKPRVIFSMTPLVRFPFTPLESEIAPAPSVYKDIINQTERIIKSRGFEFRISAETNDYLVSQILVRTSDPAVIRSIDSACRDTGFVYYREFTDEFMNSLMSHFAGQGLSIEELLRGNSFEKVPVDFGIDQKFFESKKENVKQFTDSGYCLGTIEKKGQCKGCGACTGTSRDTILAQREKSSYSTDSLRNIIRENARHTEISFLCDIPESLRGLPKKVAGSALARALMLADDSLVKAYKGYTGSYSEEFSEWPWVQGDDIVTLKFNPESVSFFEQLTDRNSFFKKVNNLLGGFLTVKDLCDKTKEKSVVLNFESPFRFDPSSFLKAKSLKYTGKRCGEKTYQCEFSADALKKNIINQLQYISTSEGSNCTVIPGKKFNLQEFLSVSFLTPSENSLVRIRIRQKITSF
jgi:radical SAM superfamily enzyme YgiQ (UPF0313 family)